jgi:predicted LPLAT superfamily acyltransferase
MTEHWSHRPEGGGRFAVGLIVGIARRCGRALTRLLLYPITLYFFLRRGPERRASRAFLARALGRRASFWQVLKHIHYFASTILDRVYLLSESFRRFDVRVHGLEQLDVEMARGRGVLLLGAHMGSFEVLRVLALRRPELRVRVVMDPLQTPAMTELLHALNPRIHTDMIDARSGGTDVVLALKEAAEQGDLLSFMADRARPQEPTRRVEFFGEPAPFPVAPYLIASALEVPVVLCFGLYRGGNRYDLHFECMAERLIIPRRERAERLVGLMEHYAQRLEHYVRLDPYNWFNFYDFWHCQDDAGAPADGAVGRESARA